MKEVWLVNGHSLDCGPWDPEVYAEKDDAFKAFFGYLEELGGEVDDSDNLYANNGNDIFWVQKAAVR